MGYVSGYCCISFKNTVNCVVNRKGNNVVHTIGLFVVTMSLLLLINQRVGVCYKVVGCPFDNETCRCSVKLCGEQLLTSFRLYNSFAEVSMNSVNVS